MDDTYVLDRDAARRMVRAIRQVERGDQNPTHPRRRRHVGGSQFRRIKFSLPSALLSTQTSKAGCTVLDSWDGSVTVGSTVTVYNELAFEGSLGGWGYADWQASHARWVIIQCQCNTSNS